MDVAVEEAAAAVVAKWPAAGTLDVTAPAHLTSLDAWLDAAAEEAAAAAAAGKWPDAGRSDAAPAHPTSPDA